MTGPFRLSQTSKNNLDTCHSLIKTIVYRSIKLIDFKVVEGHRGKNLQNKYYREGKSKLKYPDSKHNKMPSHAVHLLPYPELWEADRERFYFLSGHVLAVAQPVLKDTPYRLRWGGDWDGDDQFMDQQFHDLAHYELHTS